MLATKEKNKIEEKKAIKNKNWEMCSRKKRVRLTEKWKRSSRKLVVSEVESVLFFLESYFSLSVVVISLILFFFLTDSVDESVFSSLSLKAYIFFEQVILNKLFYKFPPHYVSE